MVLGRSGVALIVGGRPRTWSFAGYGSPVSGWPGDEPAEVLTPPSIVAAIQAGYRPMVHPSALAAGRDSRSAAVRMQPPRPERLSAS